MSKYSVNLEDGRIAQIETETPVESNEQMQQIIAQQMGQSQEQPSNDVATPDQYLNQKERFQTGFRVEPEKYLEDKRASMNLASGTKLEPTPQTASLMANIRDIPNDFLDMIGPMFPVVAQIGGGILAGLASIPTTGGTALPLAVAGGGVAGAITGEIGRQAVGKWMDLEDKGFSDRAKRVAIEGAFGAVGEGAAIGMNVALKATKRGIIKAGEKLLSRKGIEGFVKGFGKITRNFGPDEFQHALTSNRQGDDSVLKKAFASKDFGDNFTKELFFGEKIVNGKIVKQGNVARQIRNLASKKGAKEPIKQLYKEYLGLSDETFNMAVKYGQSIDKFGSKNVISEINKINSKIPAMFDDLGKKLGKARTNFASKVPGADVSQQLSAVNTQLADGLTNVGMLRQVAPGTYEIASDYAITGEGRTQSKSFIRYIDKFFSKTKDAGKTNMALLEKALISGDDDAVKAITRGKYFTPNIEMMFGDFAQSMKSLEAQISKKEFAQMGKLSPDLAGFIKGLRGVTESVADKHGDIAIKALNNEYRALAESADLLRSGSKVKNVQELSSVMSKYINPKDVIEEQTAKNLDTFLKTKVGSDVFEKIKGFKALNQLKGLETDLTKTKGRQSFVDMMKSGFSEGNSVKRDLIEKNIDPFLPKNLKISLTAKNHTTAIALQEDALSLLKARFLSSGIGLPAMVGAGTGGFVGGYRGATAGLIGGMGLQNPKILQMLVKMAAKAPARQASTQAVKGLSRTPVVGGTQLLKGLLNQ